jgi:hypothetical protein
MRQCSSKPTHQPRGTIARLVALGTRLQRHSKAAPLRSRQHERGTQRAAAFNRHKEQWSPLDSDDFEDADSSTSAAPQQGMSLKCWHSCLANNGATAGDTARWRGPTLPNHQAGNHTPCHNLIHLHVSTLLSLLVALVRRQQWAAVSYKATAGSS